MGPKRTTGPQRNSKKNLIQGSDSSDTAHRQSSGSVWKVPASENQNKVPTAAPLFPPSPPKIIIAGAPASGKGTQCEIIKERYNIVHLSTGDMLRAAVKAGSEVGMKAKKQLEAGELVSDEVIIGVVKERLAQEDCQERGWLLDGFPRTLAQADALSAAGISCVSFVFLKVPDEILVERVVGRRTDPETGKIYHLKFDPPPTKEIEERLTHRADDTEEKVKVRLKAFHENVNSIASCYTDVMFESRRQNFMSLASSVHSLDRESHDSARHIDHDFCYTKAASKNKKKDVLAHQHTGLHGSSLGQQLASPEEEINFNNPLSAHPHEFKHNKSNLFGEDSDEDDEADYDIFSDDHALETIIGIKCDHRFHKAFAWMLHAILAAVTIFAAMFMLDPSTMENEMRVRLLNPFGLLTLLLVMLGTDDIDPRRDLEAYKTGHSMKRLIKKCPNFCFTAFNLIIQKIFLAIAYYRTGNTPSFVSHVVMVILYPLMGRILHRIRIKMASTHKDEDKIEFFTTRGRGYSHQQHASNFKHLRLTESMFKNLVLTELPKIGFTTFLTIAYFSFEGYGCVHNAHLKEKEFMEANPLTNITYCHEVAYDECRSSDCISGVAECDDVVESSEAFAILFVLYAGIKLYVVPLGQLRYNFLNIMSFDLLFRDQIQILLFVLSAFGALFLFASADEIDDYCEYTDLANLETENLVVFRERSQKQRKAMNAIIRIIYFLTIFCAGLRSDLTVWKGKKRYGLAKWIQRRLSTKETCTAAPVFRGSMLIVAAFLCFGVNIPFLYFAWMARADGTFDSPYAKMAENAYSVFVAAWAFIFCCVGIYYFSRPMTMGYQKNFVYAIIPLNSIMCGIGCMWMEDWENKCAVEAANNPDVGKFDSVFADNALYNFCTAGLTIVFWPIVRKCNYLLKHDYAEREVQKHILNLFTYATTVLAPACFLFAEGTGCTHAHSYRGCYALVQANFTVELYLILSYCYFLIFGFTLSSFTVDDILNFNAPASLILQLVGAFFSSLLAFAAFGIRPRENDDAALYEDGTGPTGVYKKDATMNAIMNIRYTICTIWIANYCIQGMHVHRAHKSHVSGESNHEKKHRKHHTNLDRFWLARKERQFVKWLEHQLKVPEGDYNIRISRFFTGTAFVFVFISLLMAGATRMSPEVGEPVVMNCTDASPDLIKKYNLTDSDVCFEPMSEDVKHGALYLVGWTCMSDLSHTMAVFVIMSNLNVGQPTYRVIDVISLLIISIVFVVVGTHPNFSSDPRLIIYGLLILIFAYLAIRAKKAMIENFSPVELKKHILTMSLGMVAQLAPVIFLQCEYFGCARRGYEDDDPTHVGFNIVTLNDGTYCGSVRTGTKSVSFQVAMILVMGFVVGLFIKYSADNEDLTIEKISRLRMSRFNVFQLFTFLTTSFLALYLFGTRGKANDYYAERDYTLQDNCLLGVYLLWFVLLVTEAYTRVASMTNDIVFLADLHKDRAEELQDIEAGGKEKKRDKKQLWDLNEVNNNKKVKDKQKAFQIENKFESGRFKKAKTRGTKGNFEVPDFSPGML
ncbi:hypothetical protein TL16_g08291 [Triparma laevis f. inornata]|uniref:Adenylate kinase n=1 Tax=Triparma laevis f. inornata TaxID=1714386 RepID=A0A9W7EG40_9STRA|nr:hypothetical protein TL16_g08291 [Triparma laevis f. inornata]